MILPKACVVMMAFIYTMPVLAKTLSFDEAQQQMLEVSDAISSAQYHIDSQKQQAQATRSLRGPEVSLDVKQMRFSKTVDLEAIEPYQPLFPQFELPDEFKLQDWRTRPIITATVPIYMGGKITAAQAAADAQVQEAEAQLRSTQQSELVQLAQAYFGQQLAEQALAVRTDVRDGLQQHYDRASRLEREGFATQAQKLQAKVALDNAEREQRKAQNDLQGTQVALAGLLRSQEIIQPSTPLFVLEQPLPEASEFSTAALEGHPGLQQIRSLIIQAQQKVAAEKANYLPQFYFFGQYDFKKSDALITDSDWAIGIGMKYSLWSNQNRSRQLSAAKSQQQQANFSLQDNAVKIAIAVERAWLKAENARQQYHLLESALASADENLRLQTLSFQAGRATSLDVIDARLQQGKVRIERAQAAWEFDMALMQLLDISGQTHLFVDYVKQAHKVEKHD